VGSGVAWSTGKKNLSRIKMTNETYAIVSPAMVSNWARGGVSRYGYVLKKQMSLVSSFAENVAILQQPLLLDARAHSGARNHWRRS
jgi:hypothetical protein